MSFLMGLNESFAQVRGQLLLMDPLPPINKVFSLVSQEERHRHSAHTEMAFSVKSANSNPRKLSTDAPNRHFKKERPFCTHCQYHGHTIEKCYKIHGYPPGFRQRQKAQFNSIVSGAMVNQVSNQQSASEDQDATSDGTSNNVLQSLSTDQCQ